MRSLKGNPRQITIEIYSTTWVTDNDEVYQLSDKITNIVHRYWIRRHSVNSEYVGGAKQAMT